MGARIVDTKAQRVDTGERKREGFFTVPVVEVRSTQCAYYQAGRCSEPVWQTACASDAAHTRGE